MYNQSNSRKSNSDAFTNFVYAKREITSAQVNKVQFLVDINKVMKLVIKARIKKYS